MYLALLRGINVGGKNKLAMKDLQAMFVGAGCEGVQTYIQSGNVIFKAEPEVVEGLPDRIKAEIARQLGYHTPVVLRTTGQLRAVVASNPFLKAGVAEEILHVLFLADRPTPQSVAALDPDRSPPDTFSVQGQEVYLQLPNGAGRTKLTNAYFDSKLGTISTQRNWRTVTTLLVLLEEKGKL